MTNETRQMIAVDAEALRQVLAALNGPPDLIRKMQEGRAESGNPINELVSGYIDSSMVDKLCKDAERYRWLRMCYAGADFKPRYHSGIDLIFGVPQGTVSGDCDKTIDGLMANDTEL